MTNNGNSGVLLKFDWWLGGGHVVVAGDEAISRFLCTPQDPWGCATGRWACGARPACLTSAAARCQTRCSRESLGRSALRYRCDHSPPPSLTGSLSAMGQYKILEFDPVIFFPFFYQKNFLAENLPVFARMEFQTRRTHCSTDLVCTSWYSFSFSWVVFHSVEWQSSRKDLQGNIGNLMCKFKAWKCESDQRDRRRPSF